MLPIALNMAYRPRSRPNFAIDTQHDLRDVMQDRRLDTIAGWSGAVCAAYLEATVILGIANDPIALCLTDDALVDARTLWVAHDHMAAHWRSAFLTVILGSKPAFVGHDDDSWLNISYTGLLFAYRQFLLSELALWRTDAPILIRLFCKAIVGEHTPSGRLDEAALFDALRLRYPIPA